MRNSDALPPGYEEIAAALRKLAAEAEQHLDDLEALEQRLTVLEEKMIAAARTAQTEESLLASRQELDRQLRPYRGKMTAPTVVHAPEAIPGAQLTRKIGPAPAELVLYAISCSGRCAHEEYHPGRSGMEKVGEAALGQTPSYPGRLLVTRPEARLNSA